MNMLFWNIAKHDLVNLVSECARRLEIDVLCLAECQGVDPRQVVESLGCAYRAINPSCLNNKVLLFAKDTVTLESSVFEADRFITCTVKCDSVSYNIASTHLPDKLSDPKGGSRKECLRDIVAKLREIEDETSCNRSVVIGDFNADPFEDEMTEPDTLFSTVYRDVIASRSVRKKGGKMRHVMYNPVLMSLPKKGDIHGSYYYDKDRAPLYWHFYDQVVVSESLVGSIASCVYLRSIGSKELLKNGRPNTSISDHLPLFVKIEGDCNE